MCDEKNELQVMAVEIANTIVTYCRKINRVLNSPDFSKDDISTVQEMFRGLNHAVSSYERIYRILHGETDPISLLTESEERKEERDA